MRSWSSKAGRKTGDASASEPFLEARGETGRLQPWSPFIAQWLFNILAIVYILGTLPKALWPRAHTYGDPGSPLDGILTYERQPVYAPLDDIYTGQSLEVENNWEELVAATNVEATKQELENAAVEITDDLVRLPGGGYVAGISVMHHLHCINSLRKLVHKDQAYPNMSTAVYENAVQYADHRLHSIRRALMCKPDISLWRAKWIADSVTFPNTELSTKGTRQCVNWIVLNQWMKPRALKRHEYTVLPGPYEGARKQKRH